MTINRVGGQRSAAKERGTALLEAAIAMPVLAILVFGILEYGLLMSNASKVASGIRGGVRTAATMSNYGATSDYPILRAMRPSVKSFESSIQQIVVYRASDAGGLPSESCQKGIADGSCNVYLASDLQLTEAQLLATGRGSSWPVSSRSPLNDYVGVFVVAKYSSVTGWFGHGHTVQDHSVMRIEPTASSSSSASSQSWPLPIVTIPPTTTTTTPPSWEDDGEDWDDEDDGWGASPGDWSDDDDDGSGGWDEDDGDSGSGGDDSGGDEEESNDAVAL